MAIPLNKWFKTYTNAEKEVYHRIDKIENGIAYYSFIDLVDKKYYTDTCSIGIIKACSEKGVIFEEPPRLVELLYSERDK